MLTLTSFNSLVMPSCSSWKPDEPNPIPSTLSIRIDVDKSFPKAAATWLQNSELSTH